MINEARETLEDKVYELHAELDMTDIQRMSNDQLTNLINLSRPDNRNLVDQHKPVKVARAAKPQWQKVSATYEVRDGQLVLVEQWRKNGIVSEKIELCKPRVTYEGKQVSASILMHYLRTGEWIKRVVKPSKPFKAVAYANGKTVHIGYFATIEQKEAAIFAFKLGIV
jgi:hypothetical protein